MDNNSTNDTGIRQWFRRYIPITAVTALLLSNLTGMSYPTRISDAAIATAAEQELGEVVGEGCYDHYDEGEHWPQLVDGVEGLVTCSNNYYYFQPAVPPEPPAPTESTEPADPPDPIDPAGSTEPPAPETPPVPDPALGEVVGEGCYDHYEEGQHWPQLVDGVEGLVICSNNYYYFQPAVPPEAPVPATPPEPDPALGKVVGEGCYDHYDEGQHWPQLVNGLEGLVTCSNNYYYFQPTVPPAPEASTEPTEQPEPTYRAGPIGRAQATLGRPIGTGCSAIFEEGDRRPQTIDGVEGEVTCSGDVDYFWPIRYDPPLKNSTLNRNTMLCLYGNRAASSMGALGELTLEQGAQRLEELGEAYDQLNGDFGVVPCLDYVYIVANASAAPYSHYTPRPDLFEEALQFAADRDMLFFLDLQLGYRDLTTTMHEILPLLQRPHVHLALDTEFYMHHSGGVPGDTLGNMDAADVNLVVRMVQEYIEQHELSDKIIMVYQFDSIMLTNKGALNLSAPNVTVLINGDGVGFGGTAGKIADYQQYASEPHNALGIKLFYDWDTPVLSPEEVMGLSPIPNQVVYQ